MTTNTPIWKEKQNLATDLYDIVTPLMSYQIRTESSGMLRAVAKEVIQAGYRRGAYISDKNRALSSDLYDIIKPRVSVWIQTNKDAHFRAVIAKVIRVGYRSTKKAK